MSYSLKINLGKNDIYCNKLKKYMNIFEDRINVENVYLNGWFLCKWLIEIDNILNKENLFNF